MKGNVKTRRIVNAGILSAIAILMGITRIGSIPTPTPAGNATIMHLPTIIGGIMEGPVVGIIIGLIMGVSSFLYDPMPLFKDPLVSILPRLLIGVVAYFVYVGFKRFNVYLAIAIAGFVGSMTNTVLVLTMAVIRQYMPGEAAVLVAVTQGIPEAIVALIVTLAVVVPWKKLSQGREVKSKI